MEVERVNKFIIGPENILNHLELFITIFSRLDQQ